QEGRAEGDRPRPEAPGGGAEVGPGGGRPWQGEAPGGRSPRAPAARRAREGPARPEGTRARPGEPAARAAGHANPRRLRTALAARPAGPGPGPRGGAEDRHREDERQGPPRRHRRLSNELAGPEEEGGRFDVVRGDRARLARPVGHARRGLRG